MTPTFLDAPPRAARISPYDMRHFATYIRLLDANADGADWREAAHIIFGLDVEADPERARRVHDSHLARALWMTNSGYRLVLGTRQSA
jgi:hypothetical protein